VFACVLVVGCLAMFAVSIKKGIWQFGWLEVFCVVLLLISGVVWVLYSAPLVNLAISLTAHFAGALPTYKKVWLNPSSESTAFWLLFSISSIFAAAANGPIALTAILLPLYYVFFEFGMFLLTLRKAPAKLRSQPVYAYDYTHGR
jgi:hypothetical protein